MENRVATALERVDGAESFSSFVGALFPLLEVGEEEFDYLNRAYSLARRKGLISIQERDSLHAAVAQWPNQSPARRLALFLLLVRFLALAMDSDSKEISRLIGRTI